MFDPVGLRSGSRTVTGALPIRPVVLACPVGDCVMHNDSEQIASMTSAQPRWPFANRGAMQRSSATGNEIVHLLTKTLKRQSRLIVAIFVCGLLATIGALLLITPRFVATASILLDTRQQRVFNAEAVLPGLTDDLYIVESQLEIIRSPRIAASVLDAIGPAARAHFEDPPQRSSSLFRFWEEPQTVKVANLTDTNTDANAAVAPVPGGQESNASMIEKLLKGLSVERKGHSYMVEVRYTDIDRDRAATIANAFVDAYLSDQLEAKFQATRKANQWLSERVDEIGRELIASEQRKQKFEDQQEVVVVGSVSLLQKEMSDYAQQLVIARGEVAESRARLEQVKRLADKPDQILSLDVAQNSKVVSELRKQDAEIQRKIGDGIARFGEQHASVLAAKAEHAEVQKAFEGERKRIVQSAALAVEAANDKVQFLETGMRRLKARARELGQLDVMQSDLRRDIEVSSSLYSNLLRRYKETKAQEKLQTADARVVDRALIPARAAYPKNVLVLLLGSLGWLGIGFGIGLFRETSRPSVHNAAEAERILGVPCVAVLPTIDPKRELTGDGAPTRHLIGPIIWPTDEVANPTFSQAIFEIRQWMGPYDGNRGRVLLMTGTQAAAGCSTAAAQLARYSVETGIRAVLLDADLRTHGITSAVGLDHAVTYCEVVAGSEEPQAAIVEVPSLGFSLCPAPEIGTFRPLDVLGARGITGFIAHLRANYDLIIVDVSPIALYADARALMEHADGILLVLKAGRIRCEEFHNVVDRLVVDESQQVGTLINMSDSVAIS